MNALMQIGGNVDKASADALHQLILDIFKTGAETHMDQKTIRLALGIVNDFASVKNVNVSGCYISGSGAELGIKPPETADPSGAA